MKERGIKRESKTQNINYYMPKKNKLKTVLRKKLDRKKFKTHSLNYLYSLKNNLCAGRLTYEKYQRLVHINQMMITEGTRRNITILNSSQKSKI